MEKTGATHAVNEIARVCNHWYCSIVHLTFVGVVVHVMVFGCSNYGFVVFGVIIIAISPC